MILTHLKCQSKGPYEDSGFRRNGLKDIVCSSAKTALRVCLMRG